MKEEVSERGRDNRIVLIMTTVLDQVRERGREISGPWTPLFNYFVLDTDYTMLQQPSSQGLTDSEIPSSNPSINGDYDNDDFQDDYNDQEVWLN